jgi:hypothetical protein
MNVDMPPDFDEVPELPGPPANDNVTIVTGNKRTRRPNKRVFGDEWVNHTVQLTPR